MKQQTMQDLFRKSKEQWLEDARHVAIKQLGAKRTITIEDVLAVCPRPTYLHPNATGSVFKSKEFVAVGYTHSKRRQSHGRVVRQWQFSSAFEPIKDKDFEDNDSY